MKTNLLKWACALALCLWTATASAQEACEQSSDCPDGHFCAVSGVDCPELPGSDCMEMQRGQCEAVPEGIVQCEDQADCPAYLTCIAPPVVNTGSSSSGSSGTASGSAGGASDDDGAGDDDSAGENDGAGDEDEAADFAAPEADPNARRFCIFLPTECMADGDCADGFTCDIECAAAPICAGEDCPEPADDPCAGVTGECIPAQQPCQEDAMCANDWICAELPGRCNPDSVPVEAPPAEATPEEGAPPEPREPAPPEMDEVAPTPCEPERTCLPQSLADFYSAVANAREQGRSDNDSGSTSNPESEGAGGAAGPSADADDDDSAGCGCTASSRGPTGTSIALLAFLALFPFARRRRR